MTDPAPRMACHRISFSSSSGAMSASRRFIRREAAAPGDDQSFLSPSDTRAGRCVKGVVSEGA